MANLIMLNDSEYLSVADFYAGKSVFITGGPGFLGKVLIEKLLYSCEAIDKIYILVRDKKGVSAVDRTQEFTDNPLFARLKQDRPQDLKKLIPIAGDIAVPNLGLKPVDEEMLIDKVSLVFHSAATIKFNMPLKEALNNNVEGTRHVLDLCKRMKNIIVFVYTSTAFTNTDKMVIDEVVYPPPAELDKVYQLVKQNDSIVANNKILTGNVTDDRPNTYTFSKALAETLIERNHGNLRSIIIRPSIVTAIKDEPLKGWINNWYGATALLTFSARGLNRCVFGSSHVILDLIPVDYVALPSLLALRVKDVSPFPELCIVTKCRWLMLPVTLLLQIIPATVADLWRWLRGKQPRYVKLQSLIITTRDSLEYFTTHSWVMKCTGVRRLYASLSALDRRMFPCDPANIDWREYMPTYFEGISCYLERKNKNN